MSSRHASKANRWCGRLDATPAVRAPLRARTTRPCRALSQVRLPDPPGRFRRSGADVNLEPPCPCPPAVLLSDLLSHDRVRVPLRGASKEDAMRELVTAALPDADGETVDAGMRSLRAAPFSTRTSSGSSTAT